MKKTITFAEWAQAVAVKEPPPRPPDCLTISEWSRKLGVKWDTAARRIRKAVEAGEMERQMYYIRCGNNGLTQYPCYRIRATEKRK